MTADDVRTMLRAYKGKTEQKSFALKIGCSQQFLSDVLTGRRDPTGPVLEYLGLERWVTYRRKKP